MPVKDHHQEPFDEGTLVKLSIFEDYAKEALPVFINRKGASEIHIFDFFAGPGYDIDGVPGSPIRILNAIKNHADAAVSKCIKVVLHLNELDKLKFAHLEKAISEYFRDNQGLDRAVDAITYRRDFEQLFPELLPLIEKHPSLVFADQNGIKFLSDNYLQQLSAIREVDILFFAAASYFWRFGEESDFKKHVNLDIQELKKEPYEFVHRSVVRQLRRKLPAGARFHLYPFSIKKGANIYGTIFGASHGLAFDKYLQIAWRLDNLGGEANFDINKESAKVQPSLFVETPTKREAFEDLIETKVLAGEIGDNKNALQVCYEEGHPGSHAAEVLKRMREQGKITFEGHPLVTYDQVYRKKRLVKYVLV